jgi:hypothetical protein
MEHIIEPDVRQPEYDMEIEDDEDLDDSGATPLQSEKRRDRPQGRLGLYARILAGIAIMLLLLLVPVFTLPGAIILVLFAEVYLIDWTYSQVGQLRNRPGEVTILADPEDEVDKNVPRGAQKKQFIK